MPEAPTDPTPLLVVVAYLGLLLGLGVLTRLTARGTSGDFFVAGRSLGPLLLLLSLFGTTMTAFALVGSTGKAYEVGTGVYGLMASSSGLVHSFVFFAVGLRLWAIGKRHDLVTQVQFFRARFDSPLVGHVLFPVLVVLLIPYLLIGLVGAGAVVRGTTVGMFPGTFPGVTGPDGGVLFAGAVPPWLTGLVVSSVVLGYVFSGGLRAAAWANAFQTVVFMATGCVAFWLIARALGGAEAASRAVLERTPEHLSRAGRIGHGQFVTYALVPLSVGMFPHVFQHWLTARNAKAFRLTAVAYPLFILVVWAPCILIGVWAAGAGIAAPGGNANAVLPHVVATLVHVPWVTGLLMAGILAAIMSSLDSQFVCLGTMFAHDVVLPIFGPERFTDRQKVLIGRAFVVLVVAVTYLFFLVTTPKVFDLGVWSFSGFAGLFPVVLAALYWRRTTKAGVLAAIAVMIASWSVLFHDGFLRPMLAGQPLDEDHLVLGVMPVAIVLALTTLALVVVSALTSPPPREVVERFFVPRRTD